MKKTALSIYLILLLLACEPNKEKYNTFITKLGKDTLAVENFNQTGNQFTADVVVRSPKTVLTRYIGNVTENGGLSELKEFRFDASTGFEEEGNLFRTFKTTGDSIKITTNIYGESRFSTIDYEDDFIPFIEYVHWPYELALLKSNNNVSDTVVVPMLAGRRTLDFIITDVDGATKTIKHPFRGEMSVSLTEKKGLLTLDASKTTRKLLVERTKTANIASIARKFVQDEKQGKVFGALSAAIIENFEIKGISFTLNYGSPFKRGRNIFGGIVKYGERWRTGANRATHIKFDKDIKIGNVEAPAGEYTLFSIPEEDGGMLIVNKQTGQNGRSYNEELDLGRIPLQRKELSESVEKFTITVTENENGAKLTLEWGNTQYYCHIQL